MRGLVRDNIPSTLVQLNQKFENFEAFLIELELSNISTGIDELNSKYDNILIISNLNSEMSEPSLHEFCETFN